jgi:hypothetical protein
MRRNEEAKMKSIVRSPQAGDNVLVLAKMNSGRLTEFSGCIEDISADYAYFALDSIHLSEDSEDESSEFPLERKMWPTNATSLLRVGVLLEELKPFDGSFDEKAPCWEVKI